MDPLTDTIEALVEQGGRALGTTVPRILAAYVARTTLYTSTKITNYSWDKPLDEELQKQLLSDCIAFLSRRNDPSADTIRMQTSFETSQYREQAQIESKARKQEESLQKLLQDLLRVKPPTKGGALDYSTSSRMYDALQDFVNIHTDTAAKGSSDDSTIAKEISSALESVFPRAGLHAFVQLEEEDRIMQVSELAHLVLGIRLFNWDIGKGGAGIFNVPGEALAEAASLRETVESELEASEEMCRQYIDVLRGLDIFYALSKLSPTDIADLKEVEANHLIQFQHKLSEWANSIPTLQHQQWFAEFINRRQLTLQLSILRDDLLEFEQELSKQVDHFRQQLTQTKQLIAGRASVPKELVYPCFHALAEIWLQAEHTRQLVAARVQIHRSISRHIAPSVCSLHLATVRRVRSAATDAADAVASDTSMLSNSIHKRSSSINASTQNQYTTIDDYYDLYTSILLSFSSRKEKEEPASEIRQAHIVQQEELSETMLQSSFEYQGFCPISFIGVSIMTHMFMKTSNTSNKTASGTNANSVTSNKTASGTNANCATSNKTSSNLLNESEQTLLGLGTLVVGNPSYGIIEWQSQLLTCSSNYMLPLLQSSPTQITDYAIQIVRKFPELIHLLRLYGEFPGASLPALIHSGGRMTMADMSAVAQGSDIGAIAPTNMTTMQPINSQPGYNNQSISDHDAPRMVDASTETPVHFVEKNIIPDYTWNEWELRRRALKMATLRNAATHGIQTDKSSFTRENETQVYLPREQETQTGIERGTNPTRTVRYISGLRGIRGIDTGNSTRKNSTQLQQNNQSSQSTTSTKTVANVINLTFDLTSLK